MLDRLKSHRRAVPTWLILAVAATPTPAWCAGTGMPWEQPLQQILDSIQGPVAKIVAVIIIVTTGLTLAFGEAGGGFRRLIQIVFGLSIAFAASSFFLSFFSFGGGGDDRMSDSGILDGMTVPLHRALVEPILLAGVPRGLAILMATLAAALGLGLQMWIAGLVTWLAGHSAAAIATRRDPHIMPVLLRHARQSGYWSC